VSVAMPPPTDRDDIRTVFFIRQGNRDRLTEIARLVDAGQLRPQVGAVYPLADARKAFMDKSTQSMPGKVVLQP
jgi:NADPH:quinone reductase-like Zn-dependent oxidoreductase